MKSYFYGEWAHYKDDNEKEEVRTYLNLWKKFLLSKLPAHEFIQEQWIERPHEFSLTHPTLGLKFEVKIECNEEDNEDQSP